MRISFLLLVLAVSATLFPALPARGLSDAERIEKLARKYVIDSATVFMPQFRPKTLCYCTGAASGRSGSSATAGTRSNSSARSPRR